MIADMATGLVQKFFVQKQSIALIDPKNPL